MTDVHGILEKYWKGDTTLEEEKKLNEYFRRGEVAEEHKAYTPLFQYFEGVREEGASSSEKTLRKVISQSPRARRFRLIRNLTIAASFVLILTVGGILFSPDRNGGAIEDTYDDPELAYREFQNAIALLSSAMDKGTAQTMHISQMKHLDIVNKTDN
jgi:hypothetical protein